MNSVERGFNGNTIATTSNNEVQSRQAVHVFPPRRVCYSQFKRVTGHACQINNEADVAGDASIAIDRGRQRAMRGVLGKFEAKVGGAKDRHEEPGFIEACGLSGGRFVCKSRQPALLPCTEQRPSCPYEACAWDTFWWQVRLCYKLRATQMCGHVFVCCRIGRSHVWCFARRGWSALHNDVINWLGRVQTHRFRHPHHRAAST